MPTIDLLFMAAEVDRLPVGSLIQSNGAGVIIKAAKTLSLRDSNLLFYHARGMTTAEMAEKLRIRPERVLLLLGSIREKLVIEPNASAEETLKRARQQRMIHPKSPAFTGTTSHNPQRKRGD